MGLFEQGFDSTGTGVQEGGYGTCVENFGKEVGVAGGRSQ
ncbi:hypothetical protein ABIB17_003761 [Arthrobacter sp. UYEF6]